MAHAGNESDEAGGEGRHAHTTDRWTESDRMINHHDDGATDRRAPGEAIYGGSWPR